VKESPRGAFFFVSDDGGNYKLVFEEQLATTMAVWAEPFKKLRLPHIFNLRRDPADFADLAAR
jgi:arylsulfatase